ncbi:MAG: hypothetical protein LAP85_21110 [Acidobacteriia bacterium]|nr:hypothetical protein [Terriglobia bacterium]
MFGQLVVLVMSWIVASGSPIQAPAPPTFFVGTWNNVETPPRGPASFKVLYRDGKTFIKIRPQFESELELPEMEATAYRPGPSGSGIPQEQDAGALVVNTDQTLYVIKRTGTSQVVLERYTKSAARGRGPEGIGYYFYYSGTYAKGK